MTAARPDLDEDLGPRLLGARRVAVVGIGDELQRADRLGPLAAREIESLRLPDVRVFHAGTTPESFTGPLRRYRPDHVILLDVAQMGARAGAAAVIAPERVTGERLSTHALPLSVLMEYIEKTMRVGVTLIGLQPDLAAKSTDLTPAEESGIMHLVACLQRILASRNSPARPARPRRRRASD